MAFLVSMLQAAQGACVDQILGYFDDNLKGGEGKANTVGGQVDPERAQPIQH